MPSSQTAPSSQLKILVVDDERGIRDGLRVSLEQLGFDVETAASGEEALYQFRQNPGISFVISDFKMPGLDGFDVLKEVKKQSPQTKVVLMTGYGSVHHAVNAMQLGADDYLCKPFRFEELERIVVQPGASASRESSVEVISPIRSMLSHDSGFQIILRKAERAAKSSAPVLIEGPSGTGKELLAKQIHSWSLRRTKPWVAVNCAALPAGLLESELFGFEKGAFTGAMDRKMGKFEQANGGTMLLDEIGDLDPLLQAKLLRVLQEGEVDRLGGKRSFKVDVRIIATTNRNLEKLVQRGMFREDLFFRLYGVRFILPALKDRVSDLPVLAQEFLARHSIIQARELVFSEEVIPALMKRDWAGNIRELERSIERAAVLSENGIIQLEHFEFSNEIQPQAALVSSPRADASQTKPRHHQPNKSIREMEKEIILNALEAHSGNRTHTARSLGMSLRTLRHKLKVYREEDEGRQVDRQRGLGKTGPSFPLDAPLDASFIASGRGEILADLWGREKS